MMTLLVIIATITLGYVFLILLFSFGVAKLKKSNLRERDDKTNASIVIPFKNEEQNLPTLIQSILSLNTNQRTIEVIFVNDHSSDNSINIISSIKSISENLIFKTIDLNHEHGKKAAQHAGVMAASFDMVMFTDADCMVPQQWIDLMIGKLKDDSVMVCGAVVYQQRKSISNLVFRADFSSLVLSGAGAIGIGKPIFCNAANMLIRKTSYQIIHKEIKGKSNASGDDVFLLHAVIKHFGARSVLYCFYNEAVVSTPSPKSYTDFIKQRQRWASKSILYRNTMAVLTSFIVFMMSFTICVLAVLFTKTSLIACAAVLTLKTLADTILFYTGKKLKGNTNMYLYHILFQPVYPIYIVVTAILSLTVNPKWKQI